MMISLFLVFFLAFWPTDAADPKCPKGFTLFKRVPSARNNFTTDWCLGVFQQPKHTKSEWGTIENQMYNYNKKDYARSACAFYHSAMSIPENMKELEFAGKVLNGSNTAFVSIDGEISPHCKSVAYNRYSDREHRKLREVDFRNETGECDIRKALLFDSPDSDPKFIAQNMRNPFPSFHSSQSSNGHLDLLDFAFCLVVGIEKGNTTANDKLHIYDNTCYDHPSAKRISTSVLCGRRP